MAFHDQELHRASLLAVSMMAVALLGLLLAWRRSKLPGERGWWIPLALIPLGILFLQLPVSLPLWNLLPELRFLQFPWRWLVVLEAPMGIFFAAGVWPGKSSLRGLRSVVTAGFVILFLAASVFAARSFFQICDDEDAVPGMVSAFRAGTGFAGTEEYYPIGFDSSVLLDPGMPDGCLGRIAVDTSGGSASSLATDPAQSFAHSVCDAPFTSVSAQPEHLHIVATMPHSGDLILRRINYPAWRVKLDGQALVPHSAADVPLMVIPVAKGPLDLTVDWSATPDALLGRWITGLAVLLLTALCALERRLGMPRLSWKNDEC